MGFRLEERKNEETGKTETVKVATAPDLSTPTSRQNDPNTQPCTTCADYLGGYREDRTCGHEGKTAYVPKNGGKK